MIQIERAVRFLEKNPLDQIDMLECIQRGNGELLHVDADGVLLRDIPSGTYMLSAETEPAARACVSKLSAADLIVCHQKFYADWLTEAFGLSCSERCHQAAYLRKEPLLEPEGRWSIQTLDESSFSFVRAHYQMIPDDGYIRERLRSGMMYGAFVDGEPAGFIGMHAEGSLGLLEVLPEYRRRGIAYALEAHAINRMLERGWVPYGQVIEGNQPSMELQHRLGLSMAEHACYWMA